MKQCPRQKQLEDESTKLVYHAPTSTAVLDQVPPRPSTGSTVRVPSTRSPCRAAAVTPQKVVFDPQSKSKTMAFDPPKRPSVPPAARSRKLSASLPGKETIHAAGSRAFPRCPSWHSYFGPGVPRTAKISRVLVLKSENEREKATVPVKLRCAQRQGLLNEV